MHTSYDLRRALFFKVTIMNLPLLTLILNGDWKEFLEFLSTDYGENVTIVRINRKKCAPNRAKVKYFQLLRGFMRCPFFGYKFDAVSPPLANLSDLGVCPDLLEMIRNPISITHGPNDILPDMGVVEDMNRFGGLGIKVLEKSPRLNCKFLIVENCY